MKMKKRCCDLLACVLILVQLMTGFAWAESVELQSEEDAFSLWNKEAPSLHTLIDYVEAVTDPSSPDYIPEVDRIATFDMDGTLMGELFPTYLEVILLTYRILKDPSYTPDADMLAFGRMMRDHALDKSYPDDMDIAFSTHQARAFAGMTLTEYADFITRFLLHDADGFEGMTYANAYYAPMAEVVEYLQDYGFKCYIVSGSDRFIVRTFAEGIFDIPYEQMIGSDTALVAKNQGDTDGIEYVFTGNDTLVRSDQLIIKDLKTNKVLQIAQEIGRQPVLSFGNSSGDASMHNYVIHNNVYRSAAFMLVADDEVRDYGNAEKGAALQKQWEENGYHVISMADDWKTIYGENVVKTGTFHWLEELAEDRTPAEETAEQNETAEPEALGSVQYVMYLGTNDKNTNQPVFTESEAMERLRNVLLRHFGGYTVQEAHGGWVDGETEYQEYTLVIYLSDTTLEAVHMAADELLTLFNQSSVLIQANPTATEFYSGQGGGSL